MTGRVGDSRKGDVFVESDGHRRNWGQAFDLQWLKLVDIEYTECNHLLNPYNENQPVGLCRDGQELPHDIGSALCGLMDKAVFDDDPKALLDDPEYFYSDDEPPERKAPVAPSRPPASPSPGSAPPLPPA